MQRHHKEYARFLKRLREARLQSSFTQVEVARKLDLPQSSISKVETGERRIDALELRDLARLYRKPLEFFLS